MFGTFDRGLKINQQILKKFKIIVNLHMYTGGTLKQSSRKPLVSEGLQYGGKQISIALLVSDSEI